MLVPTRELARHTCSVVKEIGKHMNIQCMATAGETSLLQDVMQLHKQVHGMGIKKNIISLKKKNY